LDGRDRRPDVGYLRFQCFDFTGQWKPFCFLPFHPTCFLLLEKSCFYSLFTPDWQPARDPVSTLHPPHSNTNVSAFHWLFTPKVSGQLSYDLFFLIGGISPEKRNSKFETEFLFSAKLLTLLKWRASSSSFSHIWRYSKHEIHSSENCFSKNREFATKMKWFSRVFNRRKWGEGKISKLRDFYIFFKVFSQKYERMMEDLHFIYGL
jgi:hypothetical protein